MEEEEREAILSSTQTERLILLALAFAPIELVVLVYVAYKVSWM